MSRRWVGVSVALICCTLAFGSLSDGSRAQSADHASLVTQEAEVLQNISSEPNQKLVLWLSDGAPFAEHLKLFDTAFAACRQALRTNSGEVTVRANLGALYLWRDAFHPDESGNLEKAIDQFLIVLTNDPNNKEVLTYLSNYDVLSRIRAELADKGLNNVQAALQRTLKDPPGISNLYTFGRVLLFSGRTLEAVEVARALAELSPVASSQLLLGSAELKSGNNIKALTAFQSALQLSGSPVEQAMAKLGTAEAEKSMGNIDSADRFLAEAIASMSSSDLEHAARQAALDTPSELGWSLGKSYAAAGNPGKAVGYLGTEGMTWLSSEEAWNKNNEGVRLFEAHDFNGARSALSVAVQLIPMEPIYWRNEARISFELGRYRESALAFRKAASLEPLSADHVFGLALSNAVLGDYRHAQELLEKAALDSPKDDFLSYWAVDMAYGDGGWDDALQTRSRLIRQGGKAMGDDSFDLWRHVVGGINDIADRAEKQNARYLALQHESILYRALGEGLKRDLLNPDSRAHIRHEREAEFNKIIDNYRRLPLKPVVTSDIQELVLRAQPLLDSVFVSFDDWTKAVDLYERIIESAPWWPDGHYALALLACQHPLMYAFGELSNQDSGWIAGREMNAYLALIPDGPDAVRARKILEGCHR